MRRKDTTEVLPHLKRLFSSQDFCKIGSNHRKKFFGKKVNLGNIFFGNNIKHCILKILFILFSDCSLMLAFCQY